MNAWNYDIMEKGKQWSEIQSKQDGDRDQGKDETFRIQDMSCSMRTKICNTKNKCMLASCTQHAVFNFTVVILLLDINNGVYIWTSCLT